MARDLGAHLDAELADELHHRVEALADGLRVGAREGLEHLAHDLRVSLAGQLEERLDHLGVEVLEHLGQCGPADRRQLGDQLAHRLQPRLAADSLGEHLRHHRVLEAGERRHHFLRHLGICLGEVLGEVGGRLRRLEAQQHLAEVFLEVGIGGGLFQNLRFTQRERVRDLLRQVLQGVRREDDGASELGDLRCHLVDGLRGRGAELLLELRQVGGDVGAVAGELHQGRGALGRALRRVDHRQRAAEHREARVSARRSLASLGKASPTESLS